MALTLTEGSKYSTTELDRRVIDRLVKDSRVLQLLPFEELMGNSLTYNTITTDAGAGFYPVNGTWTESTPTLTQATVTLKILGGDADIDNFLLATRSNKMDLKGTILENKIKAVQYAFMDKFFYGSATSDPNEFTGLQGLISSTTYNTVSAGSTTGTLLSMTKLRQAIDLIPNAWSPTHIAMSKQLRRYITVYLDSLGASFPTGRNDWGKMVQYYDGLEIIVDDHILDTETAASGVYTAKTGGGNTTIFILSFAPQACSGVQGQGGIKTVPLGDLETKDASRYRIKWYCGLKFEDIRSCAKVDGIDADGTVAA